MKPSTVFLSIISCKAYTTQASSPSTASFITSKKTSNLRCATAVKKSNPDKHGEEAEEGIPCGGIHIRNDEDDVDVITWPSSKLESIETFQSAKQFQSEVMAYLYKNLMPTDLLNAESLGFPANMTEYTYYNENTNPKDDNDSSSTLPDGLSNGILEPTINISLHAKQTYPWTVNVTKEMYYEYVVNFANVNEARTNWRSIFHDLVQPIIQPLLEKPTTNDDDAHVPHDVPVKQVIRELNDKIWTVAASYSNTDSIKFKHGQTPLIYDPMSILLFGYASCTGLSIFFVNILRTVGIPARLAGTAAWNGKIENGNHSWIEVWDCNEGKWFIMETKPASGDHSGIDLYNPCQWWFCNKDRVDNTKFWASRLDKDAAGNVLFPMAWDMENEGVVGEDRTAFMNQLCSDC